MKTEAAPVARHAVETVAVSALKAHPRNYREHPEDQLAHLTEQRRDLETRVRYLRTDSLSKDLLEERARAVLGFSDPRDYVIRVQAQPVQG